MKKIVLSLLVIVSFSYANWSKHDKAEYKTGCIIGMKGETSIEYDIKNKFCTCMTNKMKNKFSNPRDLVNMMIGDINEFNKVNEEVSTICVDKVMN